MNSLLIYVPSYNRYEFLSEQLENLTSQIDAGKYTNIKIIVSDNASTDPRYLKLSSKFPRNYLTIRRNTVNLGLVGNLISGFLIEHWDFIWMLSDDDVVAPGAIHTIYQAISIASERDFFYLKCNVKGDERVTNGEIIDSIDVLLKKFSLYSMFGFISANIYPSCITKYIEEMYLYGYTLFPFVGAYFKCLQHTTFSVRCLGENLITWRQNNSAWTHIYNMALLNGPILAEAFKKRRQKQLFFSTFVRDWAGTHYMPVALKSLVNLRKAYGQLGGLLFIWAFILFLWRQARDAPFRIYHMLKKKHLPR